MSNTSYDNVYFEQYNPHVNKYGRPIADNSAMSVEDYFLYQNADGKASSSVDRLKQNPLVLILRAIGSPAAILNKTWRFFYTIFNIFHIPNQTKRLQRLLELGFIDSIPSQKQLWFGAYDMFRYFVVPGADSYYQTKGINFYFHVLLRFLNDPSGLSDPIGIRVPRDTIILHLLEVVHANPVYDLQLLEQFEDGLYEMEIQTLQMVAKTHPRYNSISAITEDENYHSELLDYVRKYIENPLATQLVRASGAVRDSKEFLIAEATFGTLPSAFRYFNRLPNKLSLLIKHARENKKINPIYCDQKISKAISDKLVKQKAILN
jgi:hypothetical protein